MTTFNPAISRRTPVGAEADTASGGTHFRVWAPNAKSLAVVFKDGRPEIRLDKEEKEYFSGWGAGIAAGTRYKYVLDRGQPYPDPASRYQPEGVHGFSEVVDAQSFAWSDHGWKGAQLHGQAIYEMHLGTFTQGGTWK